MNIVNVNVSSAKTVCLLPHEPPTLLGNKLDKSLSKVAISEVSRTQVQKRGEAIFTIQIVILNIQKTESGES